MPDTKITALTAIGANPIIPATFPIPMVDLTDTSMAASGTTKKVTVNQILGAGGTATFASATITGGLNTAAWFVTGGSSPGVGLANPFAYRIGGGGLAIGAATEVATTAPIVFYCGQGGVEQYRIAPLGVNTWSDGAGGTRMTLNSTGLGVGRSPATYKFEVLGNAQVIQSNFTDVAFRISQGASTTGNKAQLLFTDSSGTTGNITSYGSAYGGGLNSALAIGTGGTDRLYVDSAGNVGVGVTPANDKLLVSQTIGIMLSGATSDLNFRNGSGTGIQRIRYTDATGGLTIGSANTTSYQIELGGSTTARAVTIDTSGNLLVGTTSAAGNRLNVQTASGDCTTLIKSQAANVNSAIDYVSSYGNHTIRKSGTAVWDFGVINDSSATPAFKISNASAVGVQLVSGATAWTTLSDETVKDIIEPIGNAVAKVGSLRSVIGKFKTDSEGTRRSFLIAQDVKSVLPEAVDVVGENNELGLRYTEVIPLLVAAIKELTARVQTLEAK
jgi:hypothetical protein